MNVTKTAISAILAAWVAVALTGCVTQDREQSAVAPTDSRANSLVPLNEPIGNSTFDFSTPQFASPPHKITETEFTKIKKSMTSKEVEAILGRESDLAECPGGPLGGRGCVWYEDNATITIWYEWGGKMIGMSFRPTTHNERPD
jgi:hypothetical protein